MEKVIFVICLLFVTIIKGQFPEKICNSNTDCPKDAKLECIEQRCKCIAGYRNANNNQCTYVLGTSCYSGEECQNMAGATCEASKCVCKAGNLAGATECIKIGDKGDSCAQHSECIQRHNDNNIECKESACVCKPSFHFNNQEICVKTIDLNGSCSKDDDCYLLVGENNALLCAGGTCKCKEGYKEENGTCNGSSITMAFSIASILLLVLSMSKF